MATVSPRLREVVPHLVEGELRLDVPGSAAGLAVDAAGEALSSLIGRPVRLEHRDGAGYVDVATLHVVGLPKHCLGAYADVITAGTLRSGEDVTAP